MRRYFQSMSGLLWVALLALLIVRTSDAHVHLCLDGQSQRSSVHVADTAGTCHEADGGQDEHQDQDVNVFGAALVKKSADTDALDLPPAIDVILSLLPPERGIVHEATTQDPAPSLPYLFLPLLRGPPV